jgi:hypothetical protein
MDVRHPSYRKIALGRTSVLAAIWERKGEWVHESEVAAAVAEPWDSTQGHVAEHLAALAQHGVIDQRGSERGGHDYRDPGILDDWVTEKGLEGICEESMSWDPSYDIQPGRWLLVLGSRVIATASSYVAMRMMLLGERLPKGAVMLEVSATHRVLSGGSESRSVVP